MDHKNRKQKEGFQQLKKMIPQLLLSISIFSFLFSYTSFLLYPSKSQYYYFSTNSLHFISHAVLDKNCLFLICNGLLVFLSKTSGFIRPPSGPDLDDGLQKRIGDSLHTALQKYVLEEVAVHDKEEDEEEEEEKSEKSTESTAEEVSIFVAESEEESGEGRSCDLEENDENDSNRFWLFDDDDDDRQQLYGDEEEEMSTEELNKKIEDFIRRMKEEIIDNESTQKEMVIVN